MRVKTQNFENSIPDIFLTYRKVFGFLFLFFIHLASAHVGIAPELLFDSEEKTSLVSDSITKDQKETSSAGIIYIHSGTTVIYLNDSADRKIVILDIPKEKKIIIVEKQKTPKKVIAKSDVSKSINQDNAEVIPQVYPLSQNDLFYCVSESYTKAVVPSQISQFKAFIKPTVSIAEPGFEGLSKHIIFVFYNRNFPSVFFSFFSGRAPPVLA